MAGVDRRHRLRRQSLPIRLVGIEDADDGARIGDRFAGHGRRQRAVAERRELRLEPAAAVGRVEVRAHRQARLEAVGALAPGEDGKERLAVDDEPAVAHDGVVPLRRRWRGRRRRGWRRGRLGRRRRRLCDRRLVLAASDQDDGDDRRQQQPGGERDVLAAQSHASGRATCPRRRRAAERACRSASGERACSVAASNTSTAASGPVRHAACATSGRAPRFVRTQ